MAIRLLLLLSCEIGKSQPHHTNKPGETLNRLLVLAVDGHPSFC